MINNKWKYPTVYRADVIDSFTCSKPSLVLVLHALTYLHYCKSVTTKRISVLNYLFNKLKSHNKFRPEKRCVITKKNKHKALDILDIYGAWNKFNNCSIFHLFSMYWYCRDHQTCPSSYKSLQDLFNSNKKGITFSLKEF